MRFGRKISNPVFVPGHNSSVIGDPNLGASPGLIHGYCKLLRISIFDDEIILRFGSVVFVKRKHLSPSKTFERDQRRLESGADFDD